MAILGYTLCFGLAIIACVVLVMVIAGWWASSQDDNR